MIPVLEDGMTFRPATFSARDSEYIAARKLSREECAASYHIPLPMVGILDHATFSNIKEQHKQLYADTLGPWLEMIQEEIELQLLPETQDHENVYVEFNISEKLKGSFEEQAAALRALVGRPVMTANEGRARLNLPAITDDDSANELAAQQGGPAIETGLPDGDRTTDGAAQARSVSVPDQVAQVVRWHWERQQSRLHKLPAAERASRLDYPRALKELAADLQPTLGTHATSYAAQVTTETYTLLTRGTDAFARNREVPSCSLPTVH
jgi:hypothetical protein